MFNEFVINYEIFIYILPIEKNKENLDNLDNNARFLILLLYKL